MFFCCSSLTQCCLLLIGTDSCYDTLTLSKWTTGYVNREQSSSSRNCWILKSLRLFLWRCVCVCVFKEKGDLKIKTTGLGEDKQRLENLSSQGLPSFLSHFPSDFICWRIGINITHFSLSCDYFTGDRFGHNCHTDAWKGSIVPTETQLGYCNKRRKGIQSILRLRKGKRPYDRNRERIPFPCPCLDLQHGQSSWRNCSSLN